MIMPFIRLISIYVVVILAVVAVFKRDQIGELTGLSLPWTQTEPVAENTASQAISPPAATKPSVVAQEVTAPVAPAQADVVEDVAPQTEQPAIQMPTAEPVPVDEVAVDTAPTPPTAPTIQPARQTTAAVADTATRLNEARKTYWNGDVAGATALYAALAMDAPDNADVQGELGNVLYTQRRYAEAADAYFATGKLLVKKGNPAQVMPLINVLQSLAPQKAAALYAMMTN
jgi:hypothetical protein